MSAEKLYPEEKAMADRMKEGVDVLVCHPRLAADGLDPIDCPHHRVVRDGLLGLHDAAVMARRPAEAGEGGLHGLPEHPSCRCLEAGGQETPVESECNGCGNGLVLKPASQQFIPSRCPVCDRVWQVGFEEGLLNALHDSCSAASLYGGELGGWH